MMFEVMGNRIIPFTVEIEANHEDTARETVEAFLDPMCCTFDEEIVEVGSVVRIA